uniref:Uncharacterized protein n=1 Tax=Aureoumbra lagunensis TaxID=44058 RepID=A0A7S3K453_9STRA|mmetsp:Transcript_4066/g.5708  ORF Transcript_4066/g.5708 Transcript_4066/m.5708 type:complete len:183 (-) Transcript_4066:331-879(-)
MLVARLPPTCAILLQKELEEGKIERNSTESRKRPMLCSVASKESISSPDSSCYKTKSKRRHYSTADDSPICVSSTPYTIKTVKRSRSTNALCKDDEDARPKIKKSLSFHNQVTLLELKDPVLPVDCKEEVWWQPSEFNGFVRSELARRRELKIQSTSLLVPSYIAHQERIGSDDDSDEGIIF